MLFFFGRVFLEYRLVGFVLLEELGSLHVLVGWVH